MLGKKPLHQTAFTSPIRAYYKQRFPFIDNNLLLSANCVG